MGLKSEGRFLTSMVIDTAADLLEYAEPRNISVYLHATVHKILFTETGETKP
jgi:hypothetical protein